MSEQEARDEGHKRSGQRWHGRGQKTVGRRRVQGSRGWNEDVWWRKERKAEREIRREKESRICSREVEQRSQRWERERKWKAGLSSVTGSAGYHFLSLLPLVQVQEREKK